MRFFGNLRMVMLGPRIASGGMMAFTREPSLRRASTIGELSSIRRPSGVTMRSIAPLTARSLVKDTSVRSRRPRRSIQISSKRLTITSVTESSCSSTSSGPRPIASSSSCWLSSVRSMVSGRLGVSRMISAISARTLERSSSSFILMVSMRRASSCSSSWRCSRRRHCSRGSSWRGWLRAGRGCSSAGGAPGSGAWDSSRGPASFSSSSTMMECPPTTTSSPPRQGP